MDNDYDYHGIMMMIMITMSMGDLQDPIDGGT